MALIIAFGAAWLARFAYEFVIQQPLCFQYAHADTVPKIEQLVFSSVSIAGRYSNTHSCTFTDIATDLPVVLTFNSVDTPWFTDIAEVVITVLPVIVTLVICMFKYGSQKSLQRTKKRTWK